MDGLIWDDAASAPLHRWLSFLRLFMSIHPRVGADFYNIYAGIQKAGLQPGWNVVYPAQGSHKPVRYIQIDSKGGLHTDQHPDIPDDQLHPVYEDNLPPLETTEAWRQTLRLADILTQQAPAGMDAAWIQGRMQETLAAAQAPLGADISVDRRIGQAFALILGQAQRPEQIELTLNEQVMTVVRECFTFQGTRRQAANIIAVLLARYALQFSGAKDPGAKIAQAQQQIDALIDLTSTITRERYHYDLAGYCWLTYLGLLYGEAALLIAKQLGASGPDPEFARWCQRRALYIDEHMAHELSPSFAHPAFYAPFGFAEAFRAEKVEMPEPRTLYSGAPASTEPLPLGQLWEKIQTYSAASTLRLKPDLEPFVISLRGGLESRTEDVDARKEQRR